MVKLSNAFKETVKQIVIEVTVNAIGSVLKSIGEGLVTTEKFEVPTRIRLEEEEIPESTTTIYPA